MKFEHASDALASPARLLDLLGLWMEWGWLRPLDRAFAAFLQDQVAEAPPLLLLAAALASHQLGRGHVCLDLEKTLSDPDRMLSLPPDGDPAHRGHAHSGLAGVLDESPPPRPGDCLRGLTLARWTAALEPSALVTTGPGATPLVFTGQRLYLRRFWACEQQIAAAIVQRLEATEALRATLPTGALHRWLEILFGPIAPAEANWQRVACALAAGGAFAVITGGPGTGKTTTVVRLLALLQAVNLEQPGAPPLRIRMAAPTGKAAARLNSSVAGAVAALPLPEGSLGAGIRAAIPTEVSTVHRLLGSRPDTRHFRHHAQHPLPLDVLVVDEASMLDLELMTAVFQALPPQARLILLGDRDQLASVEAGAVLGELCARAERGYYRDTTANWLAEVSGETLPAVVLDAAGEILDQQIVMLRRSYRFDAASGIGRLARAVNAGDADAARRVTAEPLSDLTRVTLRSPEDALLERHVIHGGPTASQSHRHSDSGAVGTSLGHAWYLRVMHRAYPGDAADGAAIDAWAHAVLAAHAGFQLLCAVRRGPFGVEALNRRIEAALLREGLLQPSGPWYPGRPVIVSRNDYGLGLMNGDIGVTLAVPARDATGTPSRILRVAFPASDGSDRVRWVLPSRLVAVETVFAMTVHKAQGSEFAHAALLLPDRENPVLTRELVYTAITRARDRFTLFESRPGVLEQAIQRRVIRGSGLGEALRQSTTAARP